MDVNLFRDIDEFTGYANGDGTFHVDIQTWGKDKDGNKKQIVITLHRVMLENFTVTTDFTGDTTWTVEARGS